MSKSNHGSDHASSGSDSSGSMDFAGKVPKWKNTLDGGRIRSDEDHPLRKKTYKMHLFKCAYHAKCVKKRTCVQSNVHGRVKPLAYLHTWHNLGADLVSVPSAAAHNPKRPSSADAAAWVATHGAAFEASFFGE